MSGKEKMNPEIIFYRYNHGYCVFQPSAVKEEYRKMQEMGGKAVGLSVTTEDKVYFSLELKRHVDLIHTFGMQAIFVFGRWGGLFSAASLNSSSRETFRHPDWWKKDPAGNPPGHIVCCVNNPEFRKYFFRQAEYYFTSLPVDGLMMDEPKDSDWPCYCQYCRKLGPPEEIHIPTLSAFLGEVARFFKSIRPGGKTYLFHMPGQSESFYRATASQEGIDYLGVDGPCCGQKKATGEVLTKTPLLVSMEKVLPIVREYGKKTVVVPENFLIPEGEENTYLKNLRTVLTEKPDAVVFHYYGFGNHNPDTLMQGIRQILAELVANKL